MNYMCTQRLKVNARGEKFKVDLKNVFKIISTRFKILTFKSFHFFIFGHNNIPNKGVNNKSFQCKCRTLNLSLIICEKNCSATLSNVYHLYSFTFSHSYKFFEQFIIVSQS